MKDEINWPGTTLGAGPLKDDSDWSVQELCDHWRNLAYQEHERAERLQWMLERNLSLGSAYPKVMMEKLADEYERRDAPTSSPQPKAWPFR